MTNWDKSMPILDYLEIAPFELSKDDYLFLLKAGYPRQIATAASLFILINSISGILGQITKQNVFNEIMNYWPLFLVVLIGGQLGNFLNLKFLSNKLLTLITSGLVIFVALRIGLKIFS